MPRILIIDDEESLRYTFQSFLTREGHTVQTADNYDKAIELLESEDGFDVIFAVIILPGRRTGIDFLKAAHERSIECPIIMITGQPEIETAAEAVRQGAFDYVPKPVRRETLLGLTRSALKFSAVNEEKRRIERENRRVRQHLSAVFQSVEDVIVTLDNEMNILSANTALSEICGVMPNQVTGKSLGCIHEACMEKCGWIARQTIDENRAVRDARIECSREYGKPRLVTVNSSALRGHSGKKHGAVLVIRDITRIDRLERKLEERRRFHGIIGKSRAMQKVYRLIEDLSDLDTTVLITGESGTGKELVAEALHGCSHRASAPLVKVNCSALSENLLESELFGHVKGAFTGAAGDKAGRFEMAEGGTIILDEIGDISHAVQLKLLRVLQEREIERVGDSVTRRIDVRVISATNQDLAAKIRKGQFREDLYYRLKVMELHLPPLRERKEDIALLIEHFRKELGAKMHRDIEKISDEAFSCMLRYAWPGNVRQLKHSLEHALVICRDPEIRLEHLPEDIRYHSADAQPEIPRYQGVDRPAILEALESTGWNKAKAARRLGVSRQTLYRKMHELEIPTSEYPLEAGRKSKYAG